MNVSLLPPHLLTSADAALWHRLQEHQSALRVPHLSLDYVRAAAKGNPTVRVVVVAAKDDRRAFLPLQAVASHWAKLGVWEPVGGGMTDYFGWVKSPDMPLDLPQVLQSAGVGCIHYTHLDESQLLLGAPLGSVFRTGLRTVLPEHIEDFLSMLEQRDRRLVRDTERLERKLRQEHGPLNFEFHSANADADLKLLVELKLDQYARTDQDSPALAAASNQELLQELLRASSPTCTGCMSVLRAGSQVVALHFGIRCHDTLHYWFPVYVPAFRAYGPGRLLLRHILVEGHRLGIRRLDYGEGDTPAKREYANMEQRYHQGVWKASGARGVVGRAGLSFHWRAAVRQAAARRTSVSITDTSA